MAISESSKCKWASFYLDGMCIIAHLVPPTCDLLHGLVNSDQPRNICRQKEGSCHKSKAQSSNIRQQQPLVTLNDDSPNQEAVPQLNKIQVDQKSGLCS